MRPRSKEIEIMVGDRSAPEERDETRNDQIRAEWNRHVASLPAQDDETDADDRAHQRGQQYHERQCLPTEPGADGGEQLEIAVPHALLAGGELEEPEHRP